jgi:hypothetical protein
LSVIRRRGQPHNKVFEVAVPMVSFCDIPLSQIGFHLSIYGDYGIGMAKSWGQDKGIAPILYAYPGSLITDRLVTLIDRSQTELSATLRDELGDLFVDIACFVKPYEGKLWSKSGEKDNVRFYDEREWRFVPTMSQGFRKLLTKEDFLDEEKHLEADRKLADSFRISFEPNNIKYLIVRRDEEIVDFLRDVERIKGKYSDNERELLKSRVISAEQIRSDF